MDQSIDEIEANYIAEIRALAPKLHAWWDGLMTKEDGELVWRRWPTGVAGHPRMLAIFRKYYFQIEAFNQQSRDAFGEAPPIDPEAMWGEDDLGDAATFARHVERLIFKVVKSSPDIAEFVDGICFVPVGVDQSEEPV
jgi:hypothetical protein